MSAATIEEYVESLEEPHRSELRSLDRLIRETLPTVEPAIDRGMPAYGRYRYRYPSGREGEAALLALASRKHGISLYVNAAYGERYLPEARAADFPRASIGKSCIRFKRLADLDEDALRRLLRDAAAIGPPHPA